MKEKVIETAGKIWKHLGQKGQTAISSLPKSINEDNAVVYQALGWLAREDKIWYSEKSKKAMVALIDTELQSFKSSCIDCQPSVQPKAKEKGGNNRIKTIAGLKS